MAAPNKTRPNSRFPKTWREADSQNRTPLERGAAKASRRQQRTRAGSRNGTARLLRQIDQSNLTPAARARLQAAIAADRPVTANMVPGLGQAVRALTKGATQRGQTPAGPMPTTRTAPTTTRPAPKTSPWVRRAQAGGLPAKDMTMGKGPRADVFRGRAGSIGDVFRRLGSDPNLTQGASAELTRMTERAVNQYNQERREAGLRPIDYPGFRAPSAGQKGRTAGVPGSKGPFVPTVRLDPSRVSDQRGNTLTEVRAAVPRRSGASSSTSPGPRPNPIARKRANSNARFLRVE